jgi:enterochelin esterase family protein
MSEGKQIATSSGIGLNRLIENRRIALKAKGYEIKYAEFNGAHEYISWQGTLPDGLIELLGRPGSGKMK